MPNEFKQGSQQETQKPYSADFIAKVEAEFPHWPEIHTALDSGSESVGRHLKEASAFGMGPKSVVEAFAKGREKEILEKAEKALRIAKLYELWRHSR